MAYKLNGCDTGGFPFYLIKPILEEFEVPYFVETGTANGDSAIAASKIFKTVFTVELVEDRVKEFEGMASNFTYYVGNSVDILPVIIAMLNEFKGEQEHQWVVFYLDAHYSDNVPNESEYPECPLLDEIKAVAEYGYDSIIIIDDARLFLGSPPHPHNPTEWPSVKEVFLLLNENFPFHHITICDDYIIAIPLHIRHVIDKEWRDRFHIRYPNEQDKLKGQVKDVYKALKNYINEA